MKVVDLGPFSERDVYYSVTACLSFDCENAGVNGDFRFTS